MKIGNPADYYVQVFPNAWDEDPDQAALLADVVTMNLNLTFAITFVPDVSATAPPWPPVTGEVPTTVTQARIEAVSLAACAVTPNTTLAGQSEQTGDGVVLYVTPDEFDAYQNDLAALIDVASDAVPSVRRHDVADRAVIRFVDQRVLALLRPPFDHGQRD